MYHYHSYDFKGMYKYLVKVNLLTIYSDIVEGHKGVHMLKKTQLANNIPTEVFFFFYFSWTIICTLSLFAQGC